MLLEGVTHGLARLTTAPKPLKSRARAFSKKSKRCCSVAWCSSSRACAPGAPAGAQRKREAKGRGATAPPCCRCGPSSESRRGPSKAKEGKKKKDKSVGVLRAGAEVAVNSCVCSVGRKTASQPETRACISSSLAFALSSSCTGGFPRVLAELWLE